MIKRILSSKVYLYTFTFLQVACLQGACVQNSAGNENESPVVENKQEQPKEKLKQWDCESSDQLAQLEAKILEDAELVFSSCEQKFSESGVSADSSALLSSRSNILRDNIYLFLRSLDADQNLLNRIVLNPAVTQIHLSFNQDKELFAHALAEKLLKYSLKIKKDFTPFLGINLEHPQGEIDAMAQVPIFADVFRVARTFSEFVEKDDPNPPRFDSHGWPIFIPQGKSVKSMFLNGQYREEAVPFGTFTVLYDGEATIEYEDMASLVSHEPGKDIIYVRPPEVFNDYAIMRITAVNVQNPIKNIRIVMQGGICAGNPFVRATSAQMCPAGEYQSFVETLSADRNAIVFNPDFLWFLQDFKVVRLMNFMNATSRPPSECYDAAGQKIDACFLQDRKWQDEPQMDDSTFGGSVRIGRSNNKGVPPAVYIKMLNLLKKDIWVTIPHHADDDYNQKLAELFRDKLDYNAHIYVEYSNEMWNMVFWNAQYALQKGLAMGFGDADANPYRATYRYYVHRALQVFDIWKTIFPSREKMTRVLSSNQGSPAHSRSILAYENAASKVDALSIATYFFGCESRKTWKTECQDTNLVPVTMDEIQSVDDAFIMLKNENDPFSYPSMIKKLKEHALVAEQYNLKFMAYEGGQSLRVNWFVNGSFATGQKEVEIQVLWDTIAAANRDPRMGEMYTTLLDDWHEMGGDLINLYTTVQGYHLFGHYGLKEYALQSREESPKFDAVMCYQEEHGK